MFNQVTGFAVVCPITNQQKGYPFEVSVDGAKKTTGVILADQVKSLDWKARAARTVDSVSDETVTAVVGMVSKIIKAKKKPGHKPVFSGRRCYQHLRPSVTALRGTVTNIVY